MEIRRTQGITACPKKSTEKAHTHTPLMHIPRSSVENCFAFPISFKSSLGDGRFKGGAKTKSLETARWTSVDGSRVDDSYTRCWPYYALVELVNKPRVIYSLNAAYSASSFNFLLLVSFFRLTITQSLCPRSRASIYKHTITVSACNRWSRHRSTRGGHIPFPWHSRTFHQ